METNKPSKEDYIANPALFAGLKFYDVLMGKLKKMDFFLMTGDVYGWLLSLEDYMSFTASYMSETGRKESAAKIEDAEKITNNYITYQGSIGANKSILFNKCRKSLLNAQTVLMTNTNHLLLKTSMGDTGELDFVALSRGM